jgi:DNA-binding transcriptional LysR family regulator
MFVLPDAIARLRVLAPRVRMHVIGADAEESLPALVAGDVDFVVFDEYAGNPRMRDARIDREELLTERMLLALPTDHPLASADSVGLRDLADESWGLPAPESLYSQTITRICNEHGGFAPRVDHWANDLHVLLALTEAGHAVTIIPEMIRPERQGVALRRIGHPNLTRTILTAARSASGASPAIRAVRSALAESIEARARDLAPRHAIERPVAL